MIDQRIVILGAIVNVMGSAAYIRDTIRGSTQPNRATFAMWALAPLIAGTAEIVDGVGWAAIPTLMSGLMPAFILLASFLSGRASWRLGPFDYGCAGLSLLALIAWKVSGSGAVAIALSIAADLLAALPTVRKCYSHPGTETGWTYVAAGFNGLTGVLAARQLSFAALGFNLYLVAICATFSALIFWPRPGSERVAAASVR